MYRIATTTTQTRTPQLPHASRNTNPYVSKSIGVNHYTSVSRPQLKSYQVKDKVVPNNSQVNKPQEVEEHHRISSISRKTKSVTACNDSSKSRTLNMNAVCAKCGKCVFSSNHDACVCRYLNDCGKQTKNLSSAYGQSQALCKYCGEMTYHDAKRVYLRRRPQSNLFSVGVRFQFCDADLEVAFRKSTCFVRDLQGNDLLLYYEMSKAKRSSFNSKSVPSSKGRLNLLHMDLCGPMRVTSINGKKYILVIVDDYSRYTWTLFLQSKDETPEVLKDFLMMIQRNLQAQVISVRTDRGTEFLNKTLHAYFKEEGIEHQTSTPRTPEQKRGCRKTGTARLFEAARTMLSQASNFHYHIGEDLDKMKEKGDSCVMVGYSTQLKGYRVYNKRTRLIVESIHIKFDEIKEMMSNHNNSDLAPQRQEMSVENVTSGLVPQGQKALNYDNSDPVPPRQNVVPTAEKTDSSQQGLEFLFSPLLEEYYNPAHGHAEDNNNDQAPNASFQEAEFINPFCTRV
ncbi:retrovirus-related pol polyprotein from transposon TNT 1-94 [Tanacetum coccineum]|uniref:Retrovirus-related pol polyprotein from transposon TNT 1-94 n=1 Tax=Tanacetum coccineum TaxID=301880 RepID=A0ABQ5GMT3_9ASTR